MSRNTKVYREPTHDEITARAHQIYLAEGRPEGRATEHWLKAEALLIAERKAEAGPSAGKTPANVAAPGKPRAQQPATARGSTWQATPARSNLNTN